MCECWCINWIYYAEGPIQRILFTHKKKELVSPIMCRNHITYQYVHFKTSQKFCHIFGESDSKSKNWLNGYRWRRNINELRRRFFSSFFFSPYHKWLVYSVAQAQRIDNNGTQNGEIDCTNLYFLFLFCFIRASIHGNWMKNLKAFVIVEWEWEKEKQKICFLCLACDFVA